MFRSGLNRVPIWSESCFIKLVDKSATQLKNLSLNDDLYLNKKDVFIGGKASDLIMG